MPLRRGTGIADQVRDVVLAALRAFPDSTPTFSEHLEQFAASATTAHWAQLFAYASYHGVLTVVRAAIGCNPSVPAEIREDVDRRCAVEQLWYDHMSAELERSVSLLSSAGIDPLALKGLALARRLYPSPAMRHCMDIDLLVPPEEFDRASAALRAAGYASETGVSASYLRRYGHHLTFTRAGSVPVELHFQSYAGFGVVLPAHMLLARARPMPLSDSVSVKIPAPEDEFLYLAVHAAGHSFVRLVWLYDLKMLLRRHPVFAWDELYRRAADLHVLTVVDYAVRVLRRWMLGGAAPAALGLGARVRERLADRLLPEASSPRDVGIRANLGGLMFTAVLCDSAAKGASLVTHHVGRALRRRMQRLAPGMLPEEWSA
jgi:hypothetical protein